MMKQGRDLTSGSLFWNLVFMAVPIMLSNFIQVVYNLTDTFFLGQLEKGATQAVAVSGLAFPIIFLLASLGQGLAVATTALVSRYKGRGELDKIRQILGQTWVMNLVFLSFLAAIALTSVMPLLQALQTPAEILADANIYIQLIIFGIIMMFIFFIFQSFAVAVGDSVAPMVINIISVLINIVLDPIMIYGWLGFPAMGVRGAGVATLIARVGTVIMATFCMFRYYRNYVPALSDCKPDLGKIKSILKIAIPASLAQTTTSLGFVVMQGLVNSFGTAIITANSIGTRFVNFFMMPPMGISNALSGIIGQNLGAGKPERAIKSFHIALAMVIAIMTCGSLILYNFGDRLTAVFVNDGEVIGYANQMLKINSIAVWFFGFLFVYWGVFNGSGHTRPVMVADILRLWLIRLPMAYILSGYFCNYGFTGHIGQFIEKSATVLADSPYTALWWPMIFSNLSAVLMATWIYRRKTWLRQRVEFN
jgi:putative MATE family efflux protein